MHTPSGGEVDSRFRGNDDPWTRAGGVGGTDVPHSRTSGTSPDATDRTGAEGGDAPHSTCGFPARYTPKERADSAD